ncbi:hypothetical protein Tco_1122598 [Tanacetum coccineum]|uniref:Uncharacterized protein n=1 Tax=Tanacetum coccineum TaxID=301880 RepID=A0ABQ5J3Y5_9ASTR
MYGLTINEAFQKEDEELQKALVKAFKLPTEPHPNPYQIGWIKKEPTLKVTKICKVPLAIGRHYNELVTCDVVDMEACHVLLGRPWQHDVDATRQGKSNMYLFKWSGETIVMLPLGVVSPKKALESKTLVTLVASPKEFLAEKKETRVSYALVVKGVEDVMKNAIPALVKPLLAEFSKIMAEDTPDALPPLRNIQHQIDLSRKTTLLVSISNEVLGFDSIKELYTSDEDFGNIWMELETKQHRDCDDGSRQEEQHLVVPCSDEEIVKFPTQPAITEISGDNVRKFSEQYSLAKLPNLKQGEVWMWEIRIKAILFKSRLCFVEVIENEIHGALFCLLLAPETGPIYTAHKILDSSFTATKLVSRLANSWCRILLRGSLITVAGNNDDKNLAFLTTSSSSSTNPINTVNTGVSTGTTKVNIAGIETSTASFSDATKSGSKVNMALFEQRGQEVTIRELERKMIRQNMKFKQTMALMAFPLTLSKLDDTAFKASTYKRGLSILEAQVVKYKESEVLFSEEIALLKRSVGHKDYLMGLVKTELEKVKEEKEGFEFKLAKFEKSSKDLDALLASQVTDKSKRGFGYTAVPSPHPLILNRPTPLDLSYSGLEEFQHPEINGYGPRNSGLKATNVCDRESNNSKENTDDSLTQQPKTVNVSSSSPIKPVSPVESQLGMLRCIGHERPRGDSKNWNAINKWVPEAALMRTGLKTVKNAKPLSTARSVNTVRPVSTARAKDNTVRARGFNAVKPSACWVWRPIKPNGASLTFNKYNYIDARGRFQLTFQNHRIDGGYVTIFVRGQIEEEITGKGITRRFKSGIMMNAFQDDGIEDQKQVTTASPHNSATAEGLIGTNSLQPKDSQEEDQGIDLGNLSPSYEVSSTPHTRINKGSSN